MENKGRVMFDLNEIPEDDPDMSSQNACEPPLTEVGSRFMHPLKESQAQFNDRILLSKAEAYDQSLSSSSSSLAEAPPALGQHPLSCFRPFVRVMPKGASTNEPISSKDEVPSGDYNDKKDIADYTSSDMVFKPIQNGDVDKTLKPSSCPSDMELEEKEPDMHSNGHKSFGSMQSGDGCDSERASNKFSNKETSPQSSVNANVVSQSSRDTEDNRTTLNLATAIDNALKVDPSKGNQFSTETKFSTSFGKRGRLDQKDAMLGKKRNRQTMFLDVREAAKQAAPPKIPSVKKSSGATSRGNKDTPKTPVIPPLTIDPRLKDSRNLNATSGMLNSASPSEMKSNAFPLSDVGPDGALVSQPSMSEGSSSTIVGRQNSGKQDGEDKVKGSQPIKTAVVKYLAQGKLDEKLSSFARSPTPKKNPTPFRKQVTTYSQDSSIERLHREATCDKLWKPSGEAELQCVPGNFDSVQEYVNVFEPLLFEECRAQLLSTWEELCEGVAKDPHIQVCVKSVERRERGWYDLVVLPLDSQTKLGFKEGDVAVVSTPKPGAGIRMKRNNGSSVNEADVSSRTAGIVRRYIPIDTRDLHGATLRFYVGESQISEEVIIKKFQAKGTTWYLTVLGSLATTQREYVALHAFQNLQSQMIKAILNPKPEFFPRYEEEPPAMPECFTPPFHQHLHRHFNNPQLGAIKWAAMHTASGTHNTTVSGKRQDSWPFTLVQGPPGTGKTHTVWGMLNVIHLVQYQRYYAALLKKLAPDSLKSEEVEESISIQSGSLDDVLQKMDRNLARILPKLCPKPRMLVCAPSNAATDELLTRVLERGFIDGEMKVYRPDIARVGVDTQTRASQAVSVERRSDNLLGMSKDDVVGWLQQLRSRELFLAQQVASLQKELAAAAAARGQGSVGVDPDVLSARDHSRDTKLQQLAAIVEERDKVLVEMSRLYIIDSRLRGGCSLEDARMKLEASFANEAEIVFTTVSSSGRRLFNHLTHGFDMVVIDEAAQASEAAILTPLGLGAARCVLIGDPQQLPATVISRAAHTLQYSRSLFERFQQGGCPTLLLSVQYRMHPQIRDFPSRYFYQGRLVDSDSVSSMPDEPYHQDALLRPYIFYDVSHGRESHKGNSVSYQNTTEAHFAARLYEHLQNFIKSAGMGKVSVGVITPYKLQLRCLQQEFGCVVGADAEKVYINTVDAYQGQERDVMIMSCVRASGHGVGFVADIRRMNVALTRARRCLWVIGNAAALAQSEDWAALIADAKERGCFVTMNSPNVKNLLASRSTNTPLLLSKGPGLLKVPRPPPSHMSRAEEIKIPSENQSNIVIKENAEKLDTTLNVGVGEDSLIDDTKDSRISSDVANRVSVQTEW